jgi:hypothetical protein
MQGVEARLGLARGNVYSLFEKSRPFGRLISTAFDLAGLPGFPYIPDSKESAP